MNNLAELNSWMRQRVRPWSESEMAELGMRAVTLDGGLLRDAVRAGTHQKLLDDLLAQLPPDVLFMDLDGQIIRMTFAPGCYTDRYLIVVASEEWEALPAGGIIPELALVFKKPA